MEIHRSARKHGIDDRSVEHALEHALVVADVDDDASPSRTLIIGPDTSGNMLELVVLHFNDGRNMVIHAMPMRRRYRDMLPRTDGPTR